MAKATAKRSVRSIRHPAGDDTVRRFVDGPVRSTQPTQRNVRADSVDVDARTLTAIVATNASRIMDVYDDDLEAWITVEEVVLVDGMDFSRVESGMQFLDNHNSWDRAANLGVVTEARVEEIDGVGDAVVADIKMSSRSELDSLVQDLADGIVGCISCQYRPIESTLELRKDQYPLLTHTKSELLEVSLVSVPADPNALVRSETSLKGQNMAGKPNQGARDAAKRAVSARTAKRADEAPGATVETVDDATIAEIVDAVIAEVVPAVVEEVAAAAGDDNGGDGAAEMTDEEKAAAAEAEKKAAETGGTEVRSLIRSAVAKALGRSATPTQAPKGPDLTQLRSVAAKYGVGAEFDDMSKLGASETELRSFVLNATAARSGTGQTHDGRNKGGNEAPLTWSNTARAQRNAARGRH